MTVGFTIRAANVADCYELAETMRESDRNEVAATTGRPPVEALLYGLRHGEETWVATVDGAVLCMWGVTDANHTILGGPYGVGWLLTSRLVEEHRALFWRQCRLVLAELMTRWGMLINAIDCRHEKAIRWARRLGFQVEEPQPFGVLGLPFRRCSVRRGDLTHV